MITRLLVLPLVVVLSLMTGPGAQAATCGPAPSYQGWVQQLRATAAFSSPAGDRYASIDRTGTTVLPSGRLLTPAGTSTTVGGHPYGLVVSPDGLTTVTSNSGSVPFSLSVVQGGVVRTVVPQPAGAEVPTFFMGMAFSPDGLTLYASGGASGTIQVVDIATATVTRTLDLDAPSSGRTWRSSFLGDLAMSADGTTLYVVDQANFRLVEVLLPLTGPTIGRSLPTGRYPFSVGLSGTHAWVVNTGQYEYRPVQGFDPANQAGTALHFAPFGAVTTQSLNGAVVEGKKVPALGDPNVLSAASVWDLDLTTGKPVAQLKTGPLVGQTVDGIAATGTSGPDAVVTDGRRVYVSNGHSDTVAVLDAFSHRVVRTISLKPSEKAKDLRGVQPFGLALTPDGRTLFVAESGLNAVAVVDTASGAVLGHVPTGWLPSKVALSGTDLLVANARGFGNGPSAALGNDPVTTGAGRLGATVTNGTLQRIALPDLRSPAGAKQLDAWTVQVLRNAGLQATGTVTRGLTTAKRPDVPIKHVLVVVKENRTYDQVLGDVGAVGNRTAIGNANLANAPVVGYGEHATVAGSVDPTKPQVVNDVDITPNTHALARTFAFSDNSYADSDVSADGHRWIVGTQPDAFVETSYPQSYGQGLSYSPETGADPAPGRRGVTAAQAALAPEEYAEAGSLWENLQRHGVPFYNFGEGLELADSAEEEGAYPGGAYYGLNTPLPAALFDRSAKDFPEFNTTISDQYRMDVFQRHLARGDFGPSRTLPALTYVWLPQDHGGTPSAALGYPYLQSFPADNDAALGRLVDTMSHRVEWPSTAIVVLEDDPQGGFDSVDTHRTLGLVISPWAKRSFVSGQHTSTSSMVKTVELLLGLPMLNQADATAADLLDLFTDSYDGAPYTAIPADPRVFDPKGVKRLAVEDDDLTSELEVPGLDIDDAGDRPAGQPGGAVVRVAGKVVDESARLALHRPPRPAPARVAAQAACAPVVVARPASGLPATGGGTRAALVALLLVATSVLLRRRPA